MPPEASPRAGKPPISNNWSGQPPIFDTMMQMAEQEAGKPAQVSTAAAAMPEAWRRTELARHPERPYPMDFIEALFTDFSEIHGDRAFGDDAAMRAAWRVSRPPGDGGRQPEGTHAEGAAGAQIRLARSRGLPQGPADDEDSGEIRPPRLHLPRPGGSQPRHRRGGARAGRGDRAQPDRNGAAARSDHRHRHRRRRIGRGAGAGGCRSRSDAGKRHLHRHLA